MANFIFNNGNTGLYWNNADCWLDMDNGNQPANAVPGLGDNVCLNNAFVQIGAGSPDAECYSLYAGNVVGAHSGDGQVQWTMGTGNFTIVTEALAGSTATPLIEVAGTGNGTLNVGFLRGSNSSPTPALNCASSGVYLTINGDIYGDGGTSHGTVYWAEGRLQINGNIYAAVNGPLAVAGDPSEICGNGVFVYGGTQIAVGDDVHNFVLQGGNNSAYPQYALYCNNNQIDLNIRGSIYAGTPGTLSHGVLIEAASNLYFANGTISGGDANTATGTAGLALLANGGNCEITLQGVSVLGGGNADCPGFFVAALWRNLSLAGSLTGGGYASPGTRIGLATGASPMTIQLQGTIYGSAHAAGVEIHGDGSVSPNLQMGSGSLFANATGNLTEISSNASGCAIALNNVPCNLLVDGSGGITIADQYNSPAFGSDLVGSRMFVRNPAAGSSWFTPDGLGGNAQAFVPVGGVTSPFDGTTSPAGITRNEILVTTTIVTGATGDYFPPNPNAVLADTTFGAGNAEPGNYYWVGPSDVRAGQTFGVGNGTVGTLNASNFFTEGGANNNDLRTGKTVGDVVGALEPGNGNNTVPPNVVQDLVL